MPNTHKVNRSHGWPVSLDRQPRFAFGEEFDGATYELAPEELARGVKSGYLVALAEAPEPASPEPVITPSKKKSAEPAT